MRSRGVCDAGRLQAALNVVGGVAFVAGSLLFLDRSLMQLGIGLFVLGSVSMAFGAVAVWRQDYALPRSAAARVTPGELGPAAVVATVAGAASVAVVTTGSEPSSEAAIEPVIEPVIEPASHPSS